MVTYYFVPPGFSAPPRPPWSPRVEMMQNGGKGGNQENKAAGEEDGEKRARLVNMWKDRLNLTEEQVEKFHLIFESGHQKFISAAEASRERFSQIRSETDREINKVLNPDQKVSYEKIIEEFRERENRRKDQEHRRENNREKD